MGISRTFLFFLLTTWVAAVAQSSPSLADDTDEGCHREIRYMSRVNYTQSGANGAAILAVNTSTVSSAEECGQHCCEEATGACTIGEYAANINTNNCILLKCQPVSACVFVNSPTVHLVVISRSPKSVEKPSQSNTTTTTKPSIAFQTEKPESTSGSSRSTVVHADTTVTSKPIESVKETTILMTQPSNLLDQSSTPKLPSGDLPENPVNISELKELFNEVSQADDPMSSKNVSETHTKEEVSLDVDKNKTSKGKKGVGTGSEKENSYVTQVSTNNETAHKGSEKTNNSSIGNALHSTPTPSTTSLVTSELPTTTQLSAITSATSIRLEISTNVQSTEVPSSEPASTTLASDSTTVKLPPTPTTQPSSTTPNTQKPFKNVTELVQNVTSTAATSTKHLNSTSGTAESDDEPASDINDFKVKAKFHLVIALILGLILLITVLGLVLRRVYDVWLRRHYQRMDFLVDGMYNSVNS